MTCTGCGRELDAEAAYCHLCGAAQNRVGGPRRLFRVPSNGRIAGVCAGLADYLDTDVTLIRLVWIVLSIVPGGIIGGVIAYVAAWMIMPEGPARASTTTHRRLTRSRYNRKLGGVCGGLAEFLGIDATVVRVIWIVLTVVPGAIILGVVAYLVAWFITPEDAASAVMATAHTA
jgi:phage shock protein PspC (stress-responsive transcriptional regulator)